MSTVQDKQKEIAFFDAHASADEYDVFTPDTNARLIAAIMRLLRLAPGARVADLGCGSGVFCDLLRRAGYHSIGLDISPKLIEVGRQKYPETEFHVGDVERLPFQAASLDGVLLSGVVHHLPDPARCAAEVFRVLRPGGRFVAFDPNRMNPFMWLYRDRASPFYSPVGVTANERPVLAREVAGVFRRGGIHGGNGVSGGPALSLRGLTAGAAAIAGLQRAAGRAVRAGLHAGVTSFCPHRRG